LSDRDLIGHYFFEVESTLRSGWYKKGWAFTLAFLLVEHCPKFGPPFVPATAKSAGDRPNTAGQRGTWDTPEGCSWIGLLLFYCEAFAESAKADL